MKRFYGALVALLGLSVLAVLTWINGANVEPEDTFKPAVFQFEPDQLMGFRVVRPDATLELIHQDGVWRMTGQSWRPSRSMVRRVSHQLHDLTARAVVADVGGNMGEYGLGEGSIQVDLMLKNGETLSFQAGDPNPTSVSWYLRPIPGETVFVVKKSAIDYFRLAVVNFREKRVGLIDANEAERIEATIDGQAMEWVKVGTKTWEMTKPVAQRADRQQVRTLLGRTGALKAMTFEADAPADLSPWGLDPAPHRIKITQSGDRVVSLLVAEPVDEEGKPVTFVYREEDDAVYKVKGGFLEAFREPLSAYRDRLILGYTDWTLDAVTVTHGDEVVTMSQSSGGWRWFDQAEISGSTPKRLASLGSDVKALRFHDDGVSDGAFETMDTSIAFEHDETSYVLTLGRKWEIPPVDERDRPDRRQYLKVSGDDTVYEIDWGLGDVVEDFLRERGRKADKDAEKSLQLKVDEDEE